MSPQSAPTSDPKAPLEHRITLGYDSSRQELRFVMPQIPKELEEYAHATLHIEWKEPLEGDGTLMRTVERKDYLDPLLVCQLEDFFIRTQSNQPYMGMTNDAVRIGPAIAYLTISFQGESEPWLSDKIPIAITQELWAAIQKKADPVPKSLPQTLSQKYSIPLRTRLKVGLWRTKRRIKKLLGTKRRTETHTIQTKAPDIKPQAQPEITDAKEKETIMSTPLKVSGLTMNGSVLSWTFPTPGHTFQVAITSQTSPPMEILKQGGITACMLDIAKIPACNQMDPTQLYSVFVSVEGQNEAAHLEIKHTPPPAPAPKPPGTENSTPAPAVQPVWKHTWFWTVIGIVIVLTGLTLLIINMTNGDPDKVAQDDKNIKRTPVTDTNRPPSSGGTNTPPTQGGSKAATGVAGTNAPATTSTIVQPATDVTVVGQDSAVRTNRIEGMSFGNVTINNNSNVNSNPIITFIQVAGNYSPTGDSGKPKGPSWPENCEPDDTVILDPTKGPCTLKIGPRKDVRFCIPFGWNAESLIDLPNDCFDQGVDSRDTSKLPQGTETFGKSQRYRNKRTEEIVIHFRFKQKTTITEWRSVQ